MYVVVQNSVNAGAVSDLLMNELVADTAAELHRHQTDNIIDRQSAFIRDAPSVETLLHRLRVMEVIESTLLKPLEYTHLVTRFHPGE